MPNISQLLLLHIIRVPELNRIISRSLISCCCMSPHAHVVPRCNGGHARGAWPGYPWTTPAAPSARSPRMAPGFLMVMTVLPMRLRRCTLLSQQRFGPASLSQKLDFYSHSLRRGWEGKGAHRTLAIGAQGAGAAGWGPGQGDFDRMLIFVSERGMPQGRLTGIAPERKQVKNRAIATKVRVSLPETIRIYSDIFPTLPNNQPSGPSMPPGLAEGVPALK